MTIIRCSKWVAMIRPVKRFAHARTTRGIYSSSKHMDEDLQSQTSLWIQASQSPVAETGAKEMVQMNSDWCYHRQANSGGTMDRAIKCLEEKPVKTKRMHWFLNIWRIHSAQKARKDISAWGNHIHRSMEIGNSLVCSGHYKKKNHFLETTPKYLICHESLNRIFMPFYQAQ